MKKTVVAIIIICCVIFMCQKFGITEILADVELMQEWFVGLGFIGYFAFIVISILVSVFLLPGQFLAIIAGITYGGLVGGSLTVIGATIGSYISFVIGKYIARDFVVKKFGANAVFKKIEGGVRENGISFLVLTRLVPVFPFAIQSYAYALTPMSAGVFTIVSFVTMIPASFVYAFLASEIVVNGFSLKLLFQFAVAGIIFFAISLIPKAIAKKKNINLKRDFTKGSDVIDVTQ